VLGRFEEKKKKKHAEKKSSETTAAGINFPRASAWSKHHREASFGSE